MNFTLTDYQHEVSNTVVQRLNAAVALRCRIDRPTGA